MMRVLVICRFLFEHLQNRKEIRARPWHKRRDKKKRTLCKKQVWGTVLPYLGKFPHFGKMLVQRSGNSPFGETSGFTNCKWLKKLKALKCKFGWFLELFFALEKNLGKFCKKTGEISSRPSGNSPTPQSLDVGRT